MQRILITGGNGFIAKKLAFEISQDPAFYSYDNIVIHSRRPLDYLIELCESNTKKTFQSIIFDLCYDSLENKTSANFDLVFHLAAAASFPGDKQSYVNNITGTEKLLSSLVKSNIRSLKSFIFCSSIGAVDRARNDRCATPINDSNIEFPQSLYGKSKLECEKLIKASGLPYTIIRPSMVYGPGMRSNSHIRVLISKIAERSLSSKIYFPGKISIIHVDDLCRLITFVAKEKLDVSKIVFAAHKMPLAIGEVSTIISKYYHGNVRIYKFPFILILILRKLVLYAPFKIKSLFYDALTIDTTTAESLGFKCTIPHEDGILETLNWHSRQILNLEEKEGWAIVTGAASGIGKELSFQLYARGYKVLMIDKDKVVWPGNLEAKNSASLITNLCNPKDIEKMLNEISKTYLPISILINCAGIGHRGRIEQIDSAALEEALDLNIKALHGLCHFFIVELKKSGKKGTLINIASSAAFQPLPFMATYAASKAFVLNFTAALKEELRDFPQMKVFCICPGGVETHFQKTAGVRSNKWERLQTPQEAAYQILEATLKNNNFFIILGFKAKIMYLLGRLLGLKISSKLWRRLMHTLR